MESSGHINDGARITLFAVSPDGASERIEDLYWFEENGVHGFDGEGIHHNWTFEIWIDGVRIPSKKTANVECIPA